MVQKILKHKKILYVTLSIIFVILVGVINFIYLSSNNHNILSNDKSKGLINDKRIAIMIENKYNSGIYEMSKESRWPEGYDYNASLSKCENGTELVWDEATRSISLKADVTDKCYVYFDVMPPDVYVSTSNLPNSYGALANLSCSNSDATYNQKYNRIEISAINGKNTSCNLSYTDRTNKVYLNNYVTSLAGSTQGTGQVVNESGYRYEGKNPNNYVWFNNELWRIIGVFDSASHGVNGKNLVKIIRADTLDGLAWHKSNTNDWTAASLNKLLNGAYYNAQDGTDTGYCYGYSTTVTANCDYTQKGIQAGYRPMIANVTWYLGGYSSTSATAEAFYGYERGTTVYSGRPTSTTGYIGLMYPSDYGYSVLSTSCARTTNLGSYSSASCGGQSWLYGKGYEWTLSPRSSSSNNVFNLFDYGGLGSSSDANRGYGHRSVLYLDSSVYKIDGDGSIGNPYIIGM